MIIMSSTLIVIFKNTKLATLLNSKLFVKLVMQSLAFVHCLPELKAKLVTGKMWNHGEKESVQIELLARLLLVFDRCPPLEGVPDRTPFGELNFVTRNQAEWDSWDEVIRESQTKLDTLPDDLKAQPSHAASPPQRSFGLKHMFPFCLVIFNFVRIFC